MIFVIRLLRWNLLWFWSEQKRGDYFYSVGNSTRYKAVLFTRTEIARHIVFKWKSGLTIVLTSILRTCQGRIYMHGNVPTYCTNGQGERKHIYVSRCTFSKEYVVTLLIVICPLPYILLCAICCGDLYARKYMIKKAPRYIWLQLEHE